MDINSGQQLQRIYAYVLTPFRAISRRKLRFVYPTSLLFLLLFVLSEVLAFTLGRIINITARSTFHYDAYNVVGVYADIAPIDTRRPTYSLPDVPNVDFYGSNDGPSAAEIEMVRSI
jgi:hypothetical protein